MITPKATIKGALLVIPAPSVIPAKAGIQGPRHPLDPRIREDDAMRAMDPRDKPEDDARRCPVWP